MGLLEVALALGLVLGVDDGLALAVGLTGGKMVGEAVVLLGSPLPEIRNPTPTATPTSTR